MTADKRFESDRAEVTGTDAFSRRAFLHAISVALGVTALSLEWPEIANAAHDAHHAAPAPAGSVPPFFAPNELADVEAIVDQIIPGGETPGARDAGVAHFIDRALASFLSRLAPTFRTLFTGFQTQFHAQYPQAASFAALSSEQQVEFLKTIDRTPFFDTMRLLTVLGMFTSPEYGGNRNGLGWKLIGFQDQHAFAPPFGYYDRDYPGFTLQGAAKS